MTLKYLPTQRNKMHIFSRILLASAALVTISACSTELSKEDQATLDARVAEENKQPRTLAEVAVAEADLSTLNTAIALVGLPADLKDIGPITVFAPINEAFNKLGVQESNALMQEDQRENLSGILKNHVVKGILSAEDIAKAIAADTATIDTLGGGKLKLSLDGDKVIIEDAAGNKATVSQADIQVKDGVVHKVDTVLMPG